MNANWTVVGFILLFTGVALLLISGVYMRQEIAEVNRKLPIDKRISYWGNWPPGKFRIARSEYKRLYPAGRARFRELAYGIPGAFCIVAGSLILMRHPPV